MGASVLQLHLQAISSGEWVNMRENETLCRISGLRQLSRATFGRLSRRDAAPRSRVSKTGECASYETRAEEEGGQAARFPRPCRLEGFFTYFGLLRDQRVIGQSLAGDLGAQKTKAPRIVHVL